MKKMIFITIVLCAVSIFEATAQWAVGNEPNYGTNPSVKLTNDIGSQIEIGLASWDLAFSGQAKSGDGVLRTRGGGNMIFSIPTWDANSDSRKIVFARENASLMEILSNGQVKIGDIPTRNGYGLFVGTGILTEKLRVALASTDDWADYVFDKKYKLPTLAYVEKFINSHKHLPNVPSAEELAKEGIDVVQMQAKLLEKIEELTLYVIQLNKKNKALELEVKKIQAQNKP